MDGDLWQKALTGTDSLPRRAIAGGNVITLER
jgi:hypothetical protein